MNLNYFKVIIRKKESKEFLFPTLRICRILSGAFDWKIGHNSLPVKTGDIVLLNNLIPRRIINQNASVLELEVFEFSPTYILNRKLLPQMFYSTEPVVVSSKTRKLINDLLSVIAEACETLPMIDCSNHLLQAVLDLLEYDPHNALLNKKCTTTVLDAVEFIWAHYREDISVPAVSEHLTISKNHLENMFKDILGTSVGAYIRTVRIYKAISLLEDHPERSVLDIAFSCGFNSSSGFYKAYKDVTGRNPKRNKGEPV